MDGSRHMGRALSKRAGKSKRGRKVTPPTSELPAKALEKGPKEVETARRPLSDAEREQIYLLSDEGYRGYEIAVLVSRSPSTVSDVLARRASRQAEKGRPALYQRPGHHWSWPDPDGDGLPTGVCPSYLPPRYRRDAA